jgi:hypothetical protein
MTVNRALMTRCGVLAAPVEIFQQLEKIDRNLENWSHPSAMSAAEIVDGAASLFEPGAPLSAAAMAQMRTNPRLPEAIATFARGMLGIYRGNRLLNMLINDRGRMAIGYLALYLHDGGAPDGRGSGFGVGQLKAMCAASGVASPGRASAMLALMRMTGHVASAPANDRRRHVLVPTEKLREAHRVRWSRVAEALRVVRPDAAAAFDLGNPEFEAAYVRHSAEYWLAGLRMIDIAPEMQLFLDRNGGLMVLLSIVLSGKASDGELPDGPIPITISGLSSRFGISRVHVRTMLRDAEAAGYIQRTGESGSHVVLRPELLEAIRSFFAAVILYISHCALLAAADAQPRNR